jgi:hypothetical protein
VGGDAGAGERVGRKVGSVPRTGCEHIEDDRVS